jgi:hypothetical protein
MIPDVPNRILNGGWRGGRSGIGLRGSRGVAAIAALPDARPLRMCTRSCTEGRHGRCLGSVATSADSQQAATRAAAYRSVWTDADASHRWGRAAADGRTAVCIEADGCVGSWARFHIGPETGRITAPSPDPACQKVNRTSPCGGSGICRSPRFRRSEACVHGAFQLGSSSTAVVRVELVRDRWKAVRRRATACGHDVK